MRAASAFDWLIYGFLGLWLAVFYAEPILRRIYERNHARTKRDH